MANHSLDMAEERQTGMCDSCLEGIMVESYCCLHPPRPGAWVLMEYLLCSGPRDVEGSRQGALF